MTLVTGVRRIPVVGSGPKMRPSRSGKLSIVENLFSDDVEWQQGINFIAVVSMTAECDRIYRH